MSRYEIGIKDESSKNIYFTGYSFQAPNKETAISEYIKHTGETCPRELIYANEV